jgi:hypothetical protein
MGGVTGALSRDLLRMPSATLIAASFARLKLTMSECRPSRCRMRHICGCASSRTTCRTAPRRPRRHQKFGRKPMCLIFHLSVVRRNDVENHVPKLARRRKSESIVGRRRCVRCMSVPQYGQSARRFPDVVCNGQIVRHTHGRPYEEAVKSACGSRRIHGPHCSRLGPRQDR